MKHFFLIAVGLFCLNGYGQGRALKFSLGTSFTNDHFIFNREQLFLRWSPWMVHYPSLNVDGKYSLGLGKNMAIMIGLAYNHFEVKYENSDYVDFLGFYRDYKPERSVRNYVLPKVGISYQTSSQKKWSFYSEATFSMGLPFSSSDEKTFYGFGLQKDKLYKGDEFMEGVLFGPGLKAGMSLRPWRYGRKKNLSFTLSADAQLFFYHKSEFNPKYAIGPTLGVAYKL